MFYIVYIFIMTKTILRVNKEHVDSIKQKTCYDVSFLVETFLQQFLNWAFEFNNWKIVCAWQLSEAAPSQDAIKAFQW